MTAPRVIDAARDEALQGVGLLQARRAHHLRHQARVGGPEERLGRAHARPAAAARCHTCATPAISSAAVTSCRAERRKSATSMTRWRGSRSAHTPPISRNTASGTRLAASTRPMSVARAADREHREGQRHDREHHADHGGRLAEEELAELGLAQRREVVGRARLMAASYRAAPRRATAARYSMCGSHRSSQRGSHQFQRPSRRIAAGTISTRMTVASSGHGDGEADADRLGDDDRGEGERQPATMTMISAALVTMRPVRASPKLTAAAVVVRLQPVLAHAREQEDLVVHGDAEDGAEQHHRQRRRRRRPAVWKLEQPLEVAVLEDRRPGRRSWPGGSRMFMMTAFTGSTTLRSSRSSTR